MKIVIDFPDQEAHDTGPFPFRVEDAAGYLVLWVRRHEGHLQMLYTVARDRQSIEEQESDRGNEMMRDLSEVASRLVAQFAGKYS
jgi:hypothetical protein